MASPQREWNLSVTNPRDGARLILSSELAQRELKEAVMVCAAREAEAHLESASGGLSSGDRDGSVRRVVIEILAECGHPLFDLTRADASTLLAQLKGLVARGIIVLIRRPPPKTTGSLDGNLVANALDDRPTSRARPAPRRPRRVVSVKWDAEQAWCSEATTIRGKTENYADHESVDVEIRPQDGAQPQSVAATIDGDQFLAHWTIKDVLPAPAGARLAPSSKISAQAGGHTAPRPLTVNFVTALDRVVYRSGSAHFDLSLVDDVVEIHADIKYLPGWGGQVVKLDNSVADDTGGLLDGQLIWPGYRWMKTTEHRSRFWDGNTWQRLPERFSLTDKNHFAVGFYRDGDHFKCQYGGHWPFGFSDWNIDAPEHRTRISRWRDKIQRTWGGHFDLKREHCLSRDRKCCCYRTRVSVKFSREAHFARGMVIIAAGQIRANDSLWFLGQGNDAVAAHEFGHRLGNPDEYGSRVDPSLNSDGAHDGIDPYSIMGQNLTWVKARHLREVCLAFRAAVASAFGKSYDYRAVPA